MAGWPLAADTFANSADGAVGIPASAIWAQEARQGVVTPTTEATHARSHGTVHGTGRETRGLRPLLGRMCLMSLIDRPGEPRQHLLVSLPILGGQPEVNLGVGVS